MITRTYHSTEHLRELVERRRRRDVQVGVRANVTQIISERGRPDRLVQIKNTFLEEGGAWAVWSMVNQGTGREDSTMGYVESIEYGDGTTAPDVTDADLDSPITGASFIDIYHHILATPDLQVITPRVTRLFFFHRLGQDDLNGSTITEALLRTSTIGSGTQPSEQAFARVVFPAIAKTDTKKVLTIWGFEVFQDALSDGLWSQRGIEWMLHRWTRDCNEAPWKDELLDRIAWGASNAAWETGPLINEQFIKSASAPVLSGAKLTLLATMDSGEGNGITYAEAGALPTTGTSAYYRTNAQNGAPFALVKILGTTIPTIFDFEFFDFQHVALIQRGTHTGDHRKTASGTLRVMAIQQN